MHTRRLSLIPVSVIFLVLCSLDGTVSAKNAVKCKHQACRDHLGVYYLALTLAPKVTIGPSFYENFFSSTRSVGVWKCNGSERLVLKTLNYHFPTGRVRPASHRGL